jgi:hypothetical protein
MQNPRYDVGQADDQPTVTCRPGPWWPVVVHHIVRWGLVVTLIVLAVR